MDNTLILTLLIAAFTLVFYSTVAHFSGAPFDPREPPLIRPSIPIVGHLFGLIQNSSKYFSRLSKKHGFPPIFSIEVFSFKFYVVNSVPLISAVHRNSKTLSFAPFVKVAAERLSGLGTDVTKHFDGDEEHPGLSQEIIRDVERALLHGQEGIDLNLCMIEHLKEYQDDSNISDGKAHYFLAWIRHIVTQASTRAVYGPLNPIADQEVEDAFWDFEANASLLLINIAPSYIARKAVQAREKTAQSIFRYYQNNGQQKGSGVARARHDTPAKYGISKEDIARLEVPFLFALLSNSVPTTFWTLCHIFSCPDILAELRMELTEAITSEVGNGSARHIVQIVALKQNCPLLVSIYQEILRTYFTQPHIRQVLRDTVINDEYLLKEGAIIQLATRDVMFDTQHWGPTAAEIDLHRFVNQEKRKQTLMFRSFGGAPNLCPGKHFATTEIILIVVLMVMRYEIRPVKGDWKIPEQKQTVFAGLPPPETDIDVVIEERQGWGGDWRFEMVAPNLKFPLASG